MKYSNSYLLDFLSSADLEHFENYRKHYGHMPESIKDFHWYKSYIADYTIPPDIVFVPPFSLESWFDWPLLVQLLAASKLTDFELKFDSGKFEVIIIIQTLKPHKKVKLSSLWGFQVRSLISAIIKEQTVFDLRSKVEDVGPEIRHLRKESLKNFHVKIEKAKQEKGTYDLLDGMNLDLKD